MDEEVRAAFKLDSVPSSEVMVARRHAMGSPESVRVEFVLMGPKKPKNVTIGFRDLRKGVEYRLVTAQDDRWEDVVTGIKADSQPVRVEAFSIAEGIRISKFAIFCSTY